MKAVSRYNSDYNSTHYKDNQSKVHLSYLSYAFGALVTIVHQCLFYDFYVFKSHNVNLDITNRIYKA